MGVAHARQQIQALQEEFNRRFEVPANECIWQEEKKEEEEEQVQKAASRQMGPPAPGGRNEGFPDGSIDGPRTIETDLVSQLVRPADRSDSLRRKEFCVGVEKEGR